MRLKVSSAKRRPFCIGLNVLIKMTDEVSWDVAAVRELIQKTIITDKTSITTAGISPHIRYASSISRYLNISIICHFHHSDSTRFHGRQEFVWPQWSIPWLMKLWWRREPWHQQQKYWPSSPGIFRSQHHRSWNSSSNYYPDIIWQDFQAIVCYLPQFSCLYKKRYPSHTEHLIACWLWTPDCKCRPVNKNTIELICSLYYSTLNIQKYIAYYQFFMNVLKPWNTIQWLISLRIFPS